MNISKELQLIIQFLNISVYDLSIELGIGRKTLYRWLNETNEVTERNVELVYNYAFKNRLKINQIKEMLFREEYVDSNNLVLFHGSRDFLKGEPDLKHSKENNDFGSGFYLGETYEQAATYISASLSKRVYAFQIDITDLKILHLSISNEWMLAIAYYRGWIDKYKESKTIKNIIKKIESADVIIAPIADNRMFDVISDFVNGYFTDIQSRHSLAATPLGQQYVVKSEKALSKLELIEELYVPNNEKEFYINRRLEIRELSLDKAKVARIQYKNKGKYIEELLNE